MLLFEMVTGRLPFTLDLDNPMETIHFHIACKPSPPDAFSPEAPRVVSAIIMKLLAKAAEDRYQNAFGLAVDLKKCLDQQTALGKIPYFAPARHDLPLTFKAPDSLIGRDTESNFIQSVFHRIQQGTREIVLVSGNAGVGKSSLIQKMHRWFSDHQAFFISGNHEQLQQDIPYCAIVQALGNLMRLLLSESKTRIQVWQKALLSA